MESRSQKWFARFAWGVLAYNIPVILWGAYVRVSFSGDGCGAHWPSCNGQLLPAQMALPTVIEFTHRMMTSLDSIAVVALCAWAFLAFPKRHAVRRYAVLSLAFLLVEALLGAGLVLFRYVAKDQSAGRAWYLSAHLTNTMLLLAALTFVAWLAQTNTQRIRFRDAPRGPLGALFVTVAVSITGAIAALGDTLFPASSWAAGMRQDFSSASSLLLRLRLIHPLIAILGTAYLVWMAVTVLRSRREPDPARTAGVRVLTLALFQLAVGAINISLLAPVWLQLIHLSIADVVWISVVLLVLETARQGIIPHTTSVLRTSAWDERASRISSNT
jgi:cytochrome c oxidase assembly protein subunit 15